MSYSTDLFKNKFENQKYKKENYITYKTIFNACYTQQLLDPMILHEWRTKEYLKDKICYRNIWEQTKEGFENRSNYSYNQDNQEITFERNIIYINNNNCSTNGTFIANAHLYNCKSWFSLLIDINKEINQTVKPFKGIIKEQLEDINKDYYYKDEHIKESIYYSDMFVKHFISDYGKIGRQLLIKWLNRLNDSSVSDEELADEYINDMSNAKIYFESCNHQKYLRETKRGIKFDYILLRVIEKYSPRGRYFGNTYRSIYPRKANRQHIININSRKLVIS